MSRTPVPTCLSKSSGTLDSSDSLRFLPLPGPSITARAERWPRCDAGLSRLQERGATRFRHLRPGPQPRLSCGSPPPESSAHTTQAFIPHRLCQVFYESKDEVNQRTQQGPASTTQDILPFARSDAPRNVNNWLGKGIRFSLVDAVNAVAGAMD
ncbi:unnamed protein product [Arctogadus glacialis]